MPIHHLRRPTLYLVAFFVSALALVIAFAAVRPRAAQPARNSAGSYQEQLRKLDAQLADPRMILLRAAQFDPLAGEPEAVQIAGRQLNATRLDAPAPAALQTNRKQVNGTGYFIVQFGDRIQAEQTEGLQAQGYEVMGYVANNAYIVRAPRAAERRLSASRARGEFRWVGAYGAGLKVEPELAVAADAAGASLTAQPEITTLSFVTFPGEPAEAVRDTLQQLNLTADAVVTERYDRRVSGVVPVAQANLAQTVTALAEMEGVEWVARRQPKHLHNDNGVKIVQTGVVGTDTPLYRNGLTGAGQVVGLADSGLDDDHAQFRLDGTPAAQTLSLAATTKALLNGFLPFSVTNPNNKVLAYYLLGAGNLIDQPNNPNGGKTLDPNEKTSFGNYRNAVAYDDSNGYHGTHTTSVVAGRDYAASGTGGLPGLPTRTSNDGVAPDARIVFQDIGHPSGELPGVDNLPQALIQQQAYASGVRLHNDSYGPNAAEDDADLDEFMWRQRDYTIFFSAGNDGANPRKIGSNSKNIILVGAHDTPTDGGNLENVASYSSHGPTSDGRIKPDIIAPGTVRAATESAGTASSFKYSTSATALDAAVNPLSPNNNRSFSILSGTSFSAPMATGAGALVRQYFTDGYYPSGTRTPAKGFNPSNALVKAIMVNSARNMTGAYTADSGSGSSSLPNFGQGWGRLALDDALYFPGDRRELKVMADIWNGATTIDGTRPAEGPALMTGQSTTYTLTNVSTVEPLRLTLAWSDPKSALASAIALVNNLDLEVTDPQGTVFRGNVNFVNGYSQPAGGAAFDSKNNLEGVYIQSPVPGDYRVRIIAANVPGNGQAGVVAQPGNQTIDSNRQGYALVATGNFTAGAQALLSLGGTSVGGGVNGDRFIGRNETVTTLVTVKNNTAITANSVAVQVAVNSASQIPARLVKINNVAGQAVAVNYGDLAPAAGKLLAWQVTLLDDSSLQPGQTITFDVTITPANGPATTAQFTITALMRIVTYRTRFEPTPDPSGNIFDDFVIPESAYGLRPDNPNPAPAGDAFAGIWQLTTGTKAAANGSTASLGDPSGLGASYGVSTTNRSGLTYDDTRWWTTKKIALPGLDVSPTTNLVTNPQVAAQLKAAVESFDVDLNADFQGDVNVSGNGGDLAILRVRPYTNNEPMTALNESNASGFDGNSFTNLLLVSASTGGWKHFGGSNFAGSGGVTGGAFTIDPATPNNSDVSFRLELQMRRNGNGQTGEGVFWDNLVVRLRVSDTIFYTPVPGPTSTSVDAASFVRQPLVPGQIVSAFGRGYPGVLNQSDSASSTPLPTQFGNVGVRVNGVLAPLYYVGIGGAQGMGVFQINYQIPYGTAPGLAYVEMLQYNTPLCAEFVQISDVAPSVFTVASSGSGQASALNQDNSINGVPALIGVPTAKPEARGRVLQIYGNGFGNQLLDAVTRLPVTLPTGAAAPLSPLYVSALTPSVTIGGIPCTVEFCGLAPGYVGLWQLNVRLNPSVPTGSAVPMTITAGGRTSNPTTVAVN